MKRSAILTTGGIGAVGIALLAAIAQADVKNYSELSTLEINMSEATQIAVAAVAGDIVEAEVEIEGRLVVWEVEIIDDLNRKIFVEVDGRTGKVLSTKMDDDESEVLLHSVSLTQAIDAITAIEQGVLFEAELEAENGKLIWDMESIGTDSRVNEYQIDATTGTVI